MGEVQWSKGKYRKLGTIFFYNVKDVMDVVILVKISKYEHNFSFYCGYVNIQSEKKKLVIQNIFKTYFV